MIAIIGAMQVEIEGLLSSTKNKKNITIADTIITTGKLNGASVAICRSGIGKVHAAVAATAMLLKLPKINLMINLGVAGGIKKGIKQGDFVVAKESIQHDVDLSGEGLPIGLVEGREDRSFYSDKTAVQKICAVLKNLNYTHTAGTIVSGDQFIHDKNKVNWLKEEFAADAVDMETAIIAHVCSLFKVPFLAVRSMSDNADGGAIEDYHEFVKKAAERSISAVKAFVGE